MVHKIARRALDDAQLTPIPDPKTGKVAAVELDYNGGNTVELSEQCSTLR